MLGSPVARGVLGGIAAYGLSRMLGGRHRRHHSGGFFGAPMIGGMGMGMGLGAMGMGGGFFGDGPGEMYGEVYEEGVEDAMEGDFGD